jgi:Uma2 family endonuclease
MSYLRDELLAVLKEPDIADYDLRHRLLEALATVPAPLRMSYAEFLEWKDEDTLAEWADGEVVMTSPASLAHQDIGGFLFEVINTYVRINQLGQVVQPPFQMKLPNSGREPDLMFVANANLPRLQETYLDGPADLVVEIISPESRGRDRGEKFYEYEQAGVAEYWLIDPDRQRAEFYRLEDNLYQLARPEEGDVYRSAILPGFWLRLGWLWTRPRPATADILLEVSGETYAGYLIDRLRRRGFLT